LCMKWWFLCGPAEGKPMKGRLVADTWRIGL
jgi:hypothetical protein